MNKIKLNDLFKDLDSISSFLNDPSIVTSYIAPLVVTTSQGVKKTRWEDKLIDLDDGAHAIWCDIAVRLWGELQDGNGAGFVSPDDNILLVVSHMGETYLRAPYHLTTVKKALYKTFPNLTVVNVPKFFFGEDECVYMFYQNQDIDIGDEANPKSRLSGVCMSCI